LQLQARTLVSKRALFVFYRERNRKRNPYDLRETIITETYVRVFIT